jgi:transglutaminase-like putative cysteine protease
MRLSANLSLETNSLDPVPCIFMLHPQSAPGQGIESNELKTSVPCTFIAYTDLYGNLCQRTTVPAGLFVLESRIVATCADEIAVDPEASFTPMEEIPSNVLQFLLPSRYCEADRVGVKAREITAMVSTAYNQVDAIRQWIHDNFKYVYGTTDSSTSAVDVLASKIGVCRDYAHAGIALSRSMNIPARMAVGYLFGLIPMDLHAWFEAYVGGRWYTFDATQDRPRGDRIVVAYGRDAADVAITTCLGNMNLTRLEVSVNAV